MAFIQYLIFNDELLPMPDSYEIGLFDVEADSSGETEAGTTQRDIVRTGVADISVSFSVSPKWVKYLTAFSKMPKIAVRYFDTETLELKYAEMYISTIVEDVVVGKSRWGLLKSYAKNRDGWICLDYAEEC